jgi:ribosomal protein S18 acetylase RimI-like enzyme
MHRITYRRLTATELARIKVLWEELNRIHLADSVYFKEYYAHFSFEKRIENWLRLPEKNFHLLVSETEDMIPIGYCISTIDADRKGEIDSLFVNVSFRKQGIGKVLVEKSMEWLKANQCKPIRLTVSYGHESVLGFYQQLGFYSRLTVLEWKNDH